MPTRQTILCALLLSCGGKTIEEPGLDAALDSEADTAVDVRPETTTPCCELGAPSCDCPIIGTAPDGSCMRICDARPDQFTLITDERGCPAYRVGSGSCLGPPPDTGPPACPQEATSCPLGCAVILGEEWDPARGCVLPSKTVGCLPPGATCDSSLVCKMRTSDGAMFRFTSNCVTGFASWSDCGSPTASKVVTAMKCP